MKKLILTLLLISSLSLLGCSRQTKDPDDNGNDDTQDPIDVIITASESAVMAGTDYETPLYTYETNIAGPTIFIVGGIHGDERAGWMAAEQLRQFEFRKGTVHIMPYANIKGVDEVARYPYGYDDINRRFPGNPEGNPTDRMAYAVFQAILSKNPDYVFDLHESPLSYLAGQLGNTVIMFSTTHTTFLDNILHEFNETYNIDPPFLRYEASTSGLLNREYTMATGTPVFTFETTRGGSLGNETIPIQERVNQQIKLIEIFFQHIWEENK